MLNNPLAFGLPSRRRPRPFTLIVFGASGDLAARKIFPALYALQQHGELDEWRLLGFARRPWTDEAFRAVVATALDKAFTDSSGATANATERLSRERFLENCYYQPGDFNDTKAFKALARRINTDHLVLHYLATAPEQYPVIISQLAAVGLGAGRLADTRIVVEKPFGHDGPEAEALNLALAAVFPESAIFRMDHYLGKETVQSITAFRFANEIFEPVWNNRYIEAVEITVAETVGVGSRAAYYERSGALRDMVQNHLFQLLSLIAMEPPASLKADAIRDEKVKVLKALRPMAVNRIGSATVRAQYSAGLIDAEPVVAYRQETAVAADSMVETYCALKLELSSWRWAGVPFLLRTGKRLSRRLSEIVIHFKPPPLELFPRGLRNNNQLIFRIQPEEGLTLCLNTKVPGFGDRIRSASMDFLYGSGFGAVPPEAYERLILDALIGDGTLYIRRDEVAAAWSFIDPIRAAWEAGMTPLVSYEAGSDGPAEAAALLPGWAWRRL